MKQFLYKIYFNFHAAFEHLSLVNPNSNGFHLTNQIRYISIWNNSLTESCLIVVNLAGKLLSSTETRVKARGAKVKWTNQEAETTIGSSFSRSQLKNSKANSYSMTSSFHCWPQQSITFLQASFTYLMGNL